MRLKIALVTIMLVLVSLGMALAKPPQTCTIP